MDPTNAVASGSLQGVSGHHHHHHGGNDPTKAISSLESSIDDAAKAGKLTDDQADDMKKVLDELSQLLANQSGSTPSSDNAQNAWDTIKGIRSQLFSAVNSQDGAASGNASDQLFQKIDTNGDGKIDKSEFASLFGSSNGQSSPAASAGAGAGNGTYSFQAAYVSMVSISQQSSFSAVA